MPGAPNSFLFPVERISFRIGFIGASSSSSRLPRLRILLPGDDLEAGQSSCQRRIAAFTEVGGFAPKSVGSHPFAFHQFRVPSYIRVPKPVRERSWFASSVSSSFLENPERQPSDVSSHFLCRRIQGFCQERLPPKTHSDLNGPSGSAS